jgi:serine/threonine protein phosphatase PrpC
MGGHPEGEVAAQIALQSFAESFQKEAQPEVEHVEAFLQTALLTAHRQILRYAVDKSILDTPRTTVVAVLVQGGLATWIHSGDSRLYLVREGELLARTRDHSYMEQEVTEAIAKRMPGRVNRNVLYTCLGSPSKPVFEVTGPVTLRQGDKVLLCSDGLWGSLNDIEIVYELGQKSITQAAPDLVEKALQKAGAASDNVTVIAFEWETPDVGDSALGGVSTDTINDGVFASTVQAGWLDTSVDDLNDDEIERSIAEINDAIRRTAARRG